MFRKAINDTQLGDKIVWTPTGGTYTVTGRVLTPRETVSNLTLKSDTGLASYMRVARVLLDDRWQPHLKGK